MSAAQFAVRSSGHDLLGAVVDDPAVLHPHDPLGRIGDGLVVGDHKDRLTALVETAEQLEHLLAALAVERTGRLVGEHDGGLVGQRPGDRQALPLTAREHARCLPSLVADAEEIEQVAAHATRRRGACARRSPPA